MINADPSQIQQVLDALADYKLAHPQADIQAKQQNPVSVRVRIIDPDFSGSAWVDREPPVWKLLDTLPDEVFSNITMVLLLTPKEAEKSLANQEFEDPIPSGL